MTAVRQRTDADCGVTSLAIFATDLAMRHVDPKLRGLAALYNRELVKAGKVLGVTFRLKRTFNLDTDEGILRVRWNDKTRRANAPYGHYLAVIQACIHCPAEHVVMPWREYVVKFNAQPSTLLKARL